MMVMLIGCIICAIMGALLGFVVGYGDEILQQESKAGQADL